MRGRPWCGQGRRVHVLAAVVIVLGVPRLERGGHHLAAREATTASPVVLAGRARVPSTAARPRTRPRRSGTRRRSRARRRSAVASNALELVVPSLNVPLASTIRPARARGVRAPGDVPARQGAAVAVVLEANGPPRPHRSRAKRSTKEVTGAKEREIIDRLRIKESAGDGRVGLGRGGNRRGVGISMDQEEAGSSLAVTSGQPSYMTPPVRAVRTGRLRPGASRSVL